MSEHEFDELLSDTRSLIEAEIASERCEIEPDFAAVIAAAHERSPAQVPASAVSEAEALAPVVELRRARVDEARMLGEDQLDALLDQARELAEQDVAARRMAGIPTPPSLVPPRERRSAPSLRWAAGLVVIAAMIAGVAVAAPRLLESLLGGAQSEAKQRNQAEYLEREREREDHAESPRPRLERSEPAGEVGEAIAVPDEPESETGASVEEETRPEPPRARSHARDTKQRSLAERVAALDDEAQARWAAGELDAAAEAFRAIITLAGHSRYADLAYGDLFTLAHQRGDVAAEQALWREYLDEFPHGRFAEDARAGLCRRAPVSERSGCWQAYLDEFPQGVHRRAAERALDAKGSTEQDR